MELPAGRTQPRAARTSLLFHPTESPAAVIIGMPAGIGAMPRSLFLTADDYPPVGPMLIQMTHDATEAGSPATRSPGARIVNVDMAGLAGVPVSVTTTADRQPG